MIFPDARLLVLAFWLGAALGVLFVLYGAGQRLFSFSKYTVFFLDLIFCLFGCVLTFLLALAGTNGYLRLYWFLCECFGFYCTYTFLSSPVYRTVKALLRFFTRIQENVRTKKQNKKRKIEKNEKNT